MLRFRRLVWAYYQKHGRHDLPWRPPVLKLRRGKENEVIYKILVSEVMLQQTQVERVVPFYKKFIRQFPTAQRLAAASLSTVLKSWQGLGYNRRAKLLRDAAQSLVDTPPVTTRFNLVKRLKGLPGVGPYTARAVAAFAYNQNVIFVETNIRTAIIHHFFSEKKKVSDTEIEKILTQALPKGKARAWYSALMDYGAYLKRSGISYNVRSEKYVKQSPFTGSLREARGAILRAVVTHQSLIPIRKRFPDRFVKALAALRAEGLVTFR